MKRYSVTVNGTAYDVVVEEMSGAAAAAPAPVNQAPAFTPAPSAAPAAPAAAPKAAAPAAAPKANGEDVSSPMPGTILDIKVSNGASVKAGDILMILEAMKMENDIVAPCDGTVASVNVQKGATVNAGDLLAVIA